VVTGRPVPSTTWLLGAGASRDAGVPLANELFTTLKGSSGDVHLNATYDYVYAGAIMKAARLSVLGHWRKPDVEDVANTLDALISRDVTDLGPFVGAWHSWLQDVDPIGEPRWTTVEQTAKALERLFTGSLASPAGVDWLGEAKELMTALHGPRYPGDALLRLRRWLTREVRDRTMAPYRDLSYLAPLSRTRVGGGGDRCAGATLNYDLCVEGAFEDAGVRTCDGLEHWLAGETLDSQHGVTHVWKPHGSVRWSSETDVFSTGETDPASGWPTGKEPGIIFGGRNKLTAHGPFLDSLLAWRSALESCDSLLLVGYSFGDDHVNALIANWFRRDSRQKRVVVVDPGFNRHSSDLSERLHRRSDEAGGPDVDDQGRLLEAADLGVRIVRKTARDGLAEALDVLSR
jgi:hypothetical protein